MGTLHNRDLNDITWQQYAPGEIPANQVHVYAIKISDHLHLLDNYMAILNAEEVARANRYFQKKDRERFVISRGAQRNILSRYLNIPPALLAFKTGDNKKPYLVNNNKAIHYNLAHSADWIVLAVANAAIGADVEYIDTRFKFEDIIPENFSTEETAHIFGEDTARRFYTLWTRKEAFLKATGQGLGEYLKITPALNGQHVLQYSLLGANKDWHMVSFAIEKDYVASIAADGLTDYHFLAYTS